MGLVDYSVDSMLLEPNPEAKFVVDYHIVMRRLVQRDDGGRSLA